MSFYIRKLRGTFELLRFRTQIGRQDIPMKYFNMATCYGFFKAGNPIAGYCLVHAPLDEMNSIQQIPESLRKHIGNEDPFNYVEFTGYFLNTKKYAFKVKLHLVTRLLFHKASYIVYSYPTEQTKTEEFYLTGNPLRLYSGKSEVHSGLPIPINVEILSKWGLGKICLHQVDIAIREKIETLIARFRKQEKI